MKVKIWQQKTVQKGEWAPVIKEAKSLSRPYRQEWM